MFSLIPSSAAPAIALACLGCGGFAAAQLRGDPLPAGVEVAAAKPDDARSSGGPTGGPARWSRAPDGLFYVHAHVNGVAVRFLVDTGASVTVLTPEDAARVGAVKGESATMATVGGDTEMHWTELRQIAFGARTLPHVPAAVVAGGRSVSLLGQDVLRQMGFVSIRNDELTIG